MKIQGTPKTLASAIRNGLYEGLHHLFHRGGFTIEDYFVRWVTAHVKDFIAQKLAPLLLQSEENTELRKALDVLIEAFELKNRFETEERKK